MDSKDYQIKQIVLANGFFCALKEIGTFVCKDFKEQMTNDGVENFKEDINLISGMRSICAVKNSGDLGCSNTNSLIIDEILPI